MKKLFLVTVISAFTSAALAEPPEPANDLRKTLTAAAQGQKLAFVLLGRPTCGNCNATKTMIKEGKISVTAADFVMADLNIDDAKTQGEFMRKYGKENFGNTLPFVVITDSHGKTLASSGGYKKPDQWNALLASARGKVSGAPATDSAADAGPPANWPFKSAAPK
jgi:thioredoxin-related protein